MRSLSRLDAADRKWAALCHASSLLGYLLPSANIFAPLLVWLLKRHESDFIDRHGKEAVNFQITMTILAFVGAVLVYLLIGFALLAVIGVLNLVFVVIATSKASGGEEYRYPLTIRLVR